MPENTLTAEQLLGLNFTALARKQMLATLKGRLTQYGTIRSAALAFSSVFVVSNSLRLRRARL